MSGVINNLLTIPETARELGVSPRAIQILIRNRDLNVKAFLIEHAIIPGRHINQNQARMMAENVPERFIDGDWRNGARSTPVHTVRCVPKYEPEGSARRMPRATQVR